MQAMRRVILTFLTISGLVVLVLCCGCYSFTAETFSRSDPQRHVFAGINAEVEIHGESRSRHIPFVYWRIEEASPFTLTLRVWSNNAVAEKMYVDVATLDTEDGQSFALHDEQDQRLALGFQKRPIVNSSSSGLSTNYIHEAKHAFAPLPIRFSENLKCHLLIKVTMEPSGKSFILKQDFSGKKSREKGSIWKAYADV